MYSPKILLIGLLWICFPTFSSAQSGRGSDSNSTENDIIIEGIRHVDTIYLILNPKIKDSYRRNHIFADEAERCFFSDSLFFPNKLGKRQFAKNVFNPHVFYSNVGGSFVIKVILPQIPDDYIYKQWIDSSYSDIWYPTQKYIEGGRTKSQRWDTVVYNTNCFLAVKIKASTFTREINMIYSPPTFFFNKSKKDPYITFLIALMRRDTSLKNPSQNIEIEK